MGSFFDVGGISGAFQARRWVCSCVTTVELVSKGGWPIGNGGYVWTSGQADLYDRIDHLNLQLGEDIYVSTYVASCKICTTKVNQSTSWKLFWI